MIESLGNLCKFLNGGTPSKSQAHFFEGEIPWITSADITGPIVTSARTFITEEAISSSATNRVPAGTVLLVTRTGVGKVAITDVDLCFSQDITALILDSARIDSGYLVHFLRTKQDYFLRMSRGATIKGITRDVVSKLELPLPSLPEQRRIAAILDKAEALRTNRKSTLRQLDHLTQSVFVKMFGSPSPSQSQYKLNPLSEVCEKISDGTHHSPPIQESGIPYVTAKHLKRHGLDFFSDPWFISESDHQKIFSRCDPVLGDVLYIKDGATTGVAAINKYSFPFSMLSSLALLRAEKKTLTPEYLCNWLNFPLVKSEILGGISGAAIQRLTLTKIKNIKIPTPPLNLQQEFAHKFAKIETLKLQANKALIELNNISEALQQRAFCGKL